MLALAAHAETVRIDAGGATDSNYAPSPGLTYTIPNPPALVTDATMRYGPSFSYLIPAHNKWPYMVTMGFCEPSYKLVGERVFSVRVNNRVVVDRLDLVAEGAGFLGCLTRAVVVLASDEAMRIRFDTDRVGRNALVSFIEITPLFAPSAP